MKARSKRLRQMNIERIAELDRQLIAIIKDFKYLRLLNWGKKAQDKFLDEVSRGVYRLPKVEYLLEDYSDHITALKAYIRSLGKSHHPAISYLRETAISFLHGYHILQGVGSEAVTEHSRFLYGSPKDVLPGYNRKQITIAKYFLRVVDSYASAIDDDPLVYNTRSFRVALKHLLTKELGAPDVIDMYVDSKIAARAAAGPNYIKLRKGAKFSEADLEQLFHHEVMTHIITFMNGRKQGVLKSLGYSSPRTTMTQEGLAVFSEYINRSIELVRLKRIALRILAIDMAERGADFIDLFRFFKESGQSDEESYNSSMRIFRGGVPSGGIVFYKDNIYLRGLIEVEAFLKEAMHKGTVHDMAILFCGKLALEDMPLISSLANSGYIDEPMFLPRWVRQPGELAAHLAFNDLTEEFKPRKS